MRALILLLVCASHASAQWPQREVKVRSCSAADSLLGPMRHGGRVSIARRVGFDTFLVNSYDATRMYASVTRTSRLPDARPAPTFMFAVEGKLGQQLLSERPRHPVVELVIDDTVHLPLGWGRVGNYGGPKSSTRAPLGVSITASDAIRLARAAKAAFVIDSGRQSISQQDLRVFNTWYRYAVCDTIPFH